MRVSRAKSPAGADETLMSSVKGLFAEGRKTDQEMKDELICGG